MKVAQILHHHFVKKHVSQGLKFIICGAIGATIDLGTLVFLVEISAVNPHMGFVLSTLFAVVFVFLANKHFTFRNREKRYVNQAFKFFLVYGCAVSMNIGLSSFLLWTGIHYLISKMLAIGIIAIWNYSLSHGFVFKKNEQIDTAVF